MEYFLIAVFNGLFGCTIYHFFLNGIKNAGNPNGNFFAL